MNQTVFYLLASLSLCAAQPDIEEGSVSSMAASYDGNRLLLQGHVELDHGLGKMNAEKAILQKQEIGKDFPFSLIELTKDVLLSIKNQGKIQCAKADLDFTSLEGHLFSEGKEKISYSGIFKGKNKQQVSVRLLSRCADLHFLRQTIEQKEDYEISSLLAHDDVVIDYADSFVLRADHAAYQKHPDQISGTLTAYPKDSSSRCLLSHGSDRIETEKVTLDLYLSQISFIRPQGLLSSRFFSSDQKSTLRFSCENLLWDHAKNKLFLKKDIHLEDSLFGTLQADDEAVIIQGASNGRRYVEQVHIQGHSQLCYPQGGTHQTLTCQGTLHIDGIQGLATLTSPQDKGKVPLTQQIYYCDDQMGVHADHASLEYAEPNFELTSLVLKGNVRIFSHDTTEAPRCGLADRLSYAPNTKTVLLFANPGKRVLFWDQGQGVRMSAQEIHITEDPLTHAMQIKGIGNVQFALSAQEHAELKRFFPQYLEPKTESHE